MSEFRIIGIAVASGRIGYAMLTCDDKLVDWGASRAAALSPDAARAKVTAWIDLIHPGAIVTERPGSNARKRGLTLALMQAVTETASQSDAICVTTTKVRRYKDKYREAAALAKEFPELLPHLPKKPAVWLNEPKRMILFEALSLALRLRETR
ncbi:hypothetical protein [Microbaculum marinum]|uniref:Resolvase n=1 Tax=Microbaculum marinum TaxID=1764581 RepID=A0AAW9S3G4_9HYPH